MCFPGTSSAVGSARCVQEFFSCSESLAGSVTAGPVNGGGPDPDSDSDCQAKRLGSGARERRTSCSASGRAAVARRHGLPGPATWTQWEDTRDLGGARV